MILFPESATELRELAANIRIARKRRRLSVRLLAEKAKTSTSTLTRLEAGDPTVAIGTILQVLSALNLVRGISKIAAPENDLEQTINEARRIRLGATSKSSEHFTSEELDF